MSAEPKSRPFAAFDIDGTVIRWQLYHAISDELANKGIINKQEFESVRQARMEWKRRSGSESFHEYEQALVKVFEKALKGLRIDEFEEAAEAVFDEYKDQVYTYTRDLIRELKTKNYLLFAISGSPDVIIKRLAKYYGFDDFAASLYEAKGGHFTGKIDLSIGKKATLLKGLIDKHHAKISGSIAVADGEGDIDMLTMVEQPIAFNPSRQLVSLVTKNHWPIVIERKNVIYSLNYLNGEYHLTL